MNVAYQKRWPLYLSTKNTILKKYDGRSIFGYHELSSLFGDRFEIMHYLH
jgi:isocitrate dehydrogenase